MNIKQRDEEVCPDEEEKDERMKSIYKYRIPITDRFSLRLPKDATILSFQTQNGVPVVWAIIDTLEEITEERNFRLLGTGRPIPEDVELNYIGTTQQSIEPPLVWHLFEEGKK